VVTLAARFNAPVVLLTADARPETADAARSAGAVAVVTKPVAAAALQHVLGSVHAQVEA